MAEPQPRSDDDATIDQADSRLAPAAMPFTFAAVLVIANVVLAAGAAAAGEAEDPLAFATTLPGMFLSLAAFQGVLLVAGFFVATRSARPLRERMALGEGRLSLPTALCLAAGSLFLSWPLELLLVELGVEPGVSLDSIAATLAANPWIGPLAISVVPAIAEEVFFRGAVQQPLVRRYGPLVGIGLPAAIFGLMHLDPLQSPVAGALGAWFGWLAWRSGSLRLAVGAHFVNNLVVGLAVARVEPSEGGYADFLGDPLFTWLGAVSAAFLVVGLVLLRREKPRST